MKESSTARETEATDWRRSNANILSLISFYWVHNFIKIGQKRSLFEGDVDELPNKYKSKYLLNKFKLEWNDQLKEKKSISDDKNISLPSIVFQLINPCSCFWIILLNVSYWICMAGGTIFLQLILKYIDGEWEITEETYYVCTVFPIILFLRPILEHIARYLVSEKAQNIRVALSAAIYEKSLKLSPNAYDTAQVINILSDDCQKFELYLEYTTQTIGSSVLLLCLIYFVYAMNNWYILLGTVVMLLIVPIFSLLAPKSAEYKAKSLIYMDKRLKLIKEAVVGYLNTKMYGWEPTICKLVEDTRDEEIKYLIKKGRISASIFSIMTISDTLALTVIMLTYFYVEGVLLLSMVYPVLSLYMNMKIFLLIYLPKTLETHYGMKIAIKRIMHFLQLPELQQLPARKGDINRSDPSICIENGLFFWPEENLTNDEDNDKNKSKMNRYDSLQSIASHSTQLSSGSLSKIALTSIDLAVAGNELIAVIGKVGSGKTSLLLSIIGELELLDTADTKFEINGKIGYCSQVPWIFNDSVKENILFGNKYDEEWYKKVIFACSLDKDFDELPHSDETIIGSRGINISGGQKTRVNLARCIYDKPDILLLDDILSSVDSIVSKHIFQNVLNNNNGLMNNTLRILVTHQINILPFTDKIIIMENSKIIQTDNYKNLKQMQSVNINELLLHSHLERTMEKEEQITNTNQEQEGKYDDDDTMTASTKQIKNKYKSKKNIYQVAREQSVIQIEESQIGSVPFSAYLTILFPNTRSKCIRYFKAFLLLSLILSATFLQAASQYWLGIWATVSPEKQSQPLYIIVYVVLATLGIIVHFIENVSLWQILFNGSLSLHNKMFRGVLYSSMKFYESNPVGRILNRFSQDQLNVDEMLPEAIATTVWAFGQIVLLYVLIGMLYPYLYLLVVPITIFCGWICKLYLNTSRSLRRLEATTKSPIYSYFNSCSSGLSTIRAYNKQHFVLETLFKYLETNVAVLLIYIGCQRWIAFVLDICLSICTTIVLFICIYLSDEISTAAVGITLTYFLIGATTLSYGMRQFADAENFMTSTERIIEYGNLKTEVDELQIDKNKLIEPDCNWPEKGNINFINLSVSYREHLDPVLKNVNISINDGEKVGIVGRTGSGKSTLLKSLFRLLSYHSGHIEIDGINICNISLKTLRKCLFIIPQNCILFSSTLRYNLDPFNEYTDDQLMEVLKEVQLNISHDDDDDENELTLNSLMSEYGSNLSVGEAQLICVGRAILNYSKNKILLIDEATSNIDQFTDNIIQKLFQKKLFKNKTVLTIAHRINTIIDYDKILVLDKGEIIEFDDPNNLLNDNTSIFYKMYHKQHH